MNLDSLIHVIAYAGRILLESGAETYRVEETMVRIASSFQVEDAQSFVTPTGVMLSITKDKKTCSHIMRVQNRGVDLHKIDLVNDLSRSVCNTPLTVDALSEKLKEIDAMKRYSNFVTILFGALSAGGFAFFFQGTIIDATAAFFVGIAIKSCMILMDKYKMNVFFSNSIAAGIAAFLTLSFKMIQPVSDVDTIIISSIMLLVPGLAITNAIRDTVAGDFLSGVSRATEAVLISIAIAVGTGAVLSTWIKFMGGM